MASEVSETHHSPPALAEMHVVWVTAGLGCDGDTIAMTAATQPSLEDLVMGALPGVPRVLLHNPVLASENANESSRSCSSPPTGDSIRSSSLRKLRPRRDARR